MVSETSPAILSPCPGPQWYRCKKYPSPLSPSISLLGWLLSVLPNSNQLPPPLEKPVLVVLISVTSARSIHYTLFYHRSYYIICFLECSKKNYKDLHTWNRVLTTKTPQHSVWPRHLRTVQNTGNSSIQTWGQFYVRAACCILNARPLIPPLELPLLHSQEINQPHVLVLFTQIVHSPQSCVIPYIRPLSPSQVSPPTTLCYGPTQKSPVL